MHIEPPDVQLTAEAVSGVLGPSTFVRTIHAFDSIDSTNDYAKTLVGQGKTALIISEEQTQGHGRLGRQWHSEKGKNLTFSLVVKSGISPDRLGVLTLCAAESVAGAVESHARVSIKTKWPNDLLIDGKKVCGILMESVMMGGKLDALIIGVGLNVNQRKFPSDLTATSLNLSTGKPADRLVLLPEIVNRLAWLNGTISSSDVATKLEGWKARCEMFGKLVRVQSGGTTLKGVGKGIAEDGGLLLEVNGTEQKVHSGDITMPGGRELE